MDHVDDPTAERFGAALLGLGVLALSLLFSIVGVVIVTIMLAWWMTLTWQSEPMSLWPIAITLFISAVVAAPIAGAVLRPNNDLGSAWTIVVSLSLTAFVAVELSPVVVVSTGPYVAAVCAAFVSGGVLLVRPPPDGSVRD